MRRGGVGAAGMVFAAGGSIRAEALTYGMRGCMAGVDRVQCERGRAQEGDGCESRLRRRMLTGWRPSGVFAGSVSNALKGLCYACVCNDADGNGGFGD